MRQQFVEYFARNPMLASFGMDFALKFGGEDQKHKKGLHRKILGHLITFTRSVLRFHRKKALVGCGDLFWGKSLLVLSC